MQISTVRWWAHHEVLVITNDTLLLRPIDASYIYRPCSQLKIVCISTEKYLNKCIDVNRPPTFFLPLSLLFFHLYRYCVSFAPILFSFAPILSFISAPIVYIISRWMKFLFLFIDIFSYPVVYLCYELSIVRCIIYLVALPPSPFCSSGEDFQQDK